MEKHSLIFEVLLKNIIRILFDNLSFGELCILIL